MAAVDGCSWQFMARFKGRGWSDFNRQRIKILLVVVVDSGAEESVVESQVLGGYCGRFMAAIVGGV